MKSRHHNTKQYLTGIARQALLLLILLLCMGGSAWGQTIIKQGTINSQSDVATYYQLLNECPQDITSQLGDLSSWTHNNITQRRSQHWDGTTDNNSGSPYFENYSGWSDNSWTATMTKTITLPKGKYVLVGPARSSAKAHAYMKVGGGDTKVYIHNGGDEGLGINTNGLPSFSGSDTYANNGTPEQGHQRGRGWRYTYIQFELNSTQSVTFELGGGGSEEHQWMSFTNPRLMSEGVNLDSGLFHEWDGTSANSNITIQDPSNFVCIVGNEVASGQVMYGNNNGAVPSNQYANLSQYDKLVVTYDNTKALPRFLFNKADENNVLSVESTGDYMTIDGNQIIIHLAKIASDKGYAHLNCIKAPWGGTAQITDARLQKAYIPTIIEKTIAVGSDNTIRLDGNLLSDHIPYNYIRIELVDGSDQGRYITPATNGQDMTQPVEYATFKVESWAGDKQGDYTHLANDVYACASLGQWYDGLLVSSGTFIFKIPNTNRSSYRNNHIRIYLARYNDNSYGVNNPPEIEKTYDYTLWLAGNESQSQVHQLYDNNNGASSFDVDLYNLTNYGTDILSHFNKSQFSDFNNFYLRWYVADKVTHQPIADENGNPISLNTPVLMPTTSYTTQLFHEDVGMLWYLREGWIGGSSPSAELNAHAQEVLKVQVNLPNGLTQNDVELVALVTDDYTDSDVGAEPPNMKHKYIVSFEDNAEAQYKNLPFRHYKGVAGRDWVTPEGSAGSMTQEIWTADASYNKLLPTTAENDPTKGTVSQTSADVRQGVHTWEYNVYITPADGQRALILPFENYMYGYDTSISSDGNDLEPRAYFRWYDWKTDQAVVTNSDYTFRACNSDILKPYMETVGGVTRDRGLIALNLDPDHPTQGRVGVWLTVNNNFNLDNYPKGIDIACDVSKYSDGIRIFGTNAYLEHEPTLSMRYIFHIYPGKKIADELAEAKTNLSKARLALENSNLSASDRLDLYTMLEYYGKDDIQPMFALPEDKGRVVVSLGNGKSGEFSLRLDENLLENYKLWNASNELVSADGVKWVAFYENEKTGNVMRKELLTEPSTERIQTFTYSNFTGNFYPLGSSETTTVSDGMKFHVVGYVTSGDVNTLQGTGVYAPVVHYELQFLVAPPLPVVKLKSNADDVRINNIRRTDEYMAQHYDLQNVVDFDGNPETNPNLTTFPDRKYSFYSTNNWYDQPTTRGNNMSWMPREWTDIEYSYCYPQLCDYVIDSYPGYWQYNNFLSPFHGDYMILKSMNIGGISDQRQTDQDYKLQWWWGSQLYDYTHVYTDNSKYGSFLYTDASNESRTMITIPFTADLCGGSSIYFTAAVADMTNATIKPQLLIRIVGIDNDGNRKQVVSFHTCDISTTGASTGEWYQIYGESTIPANFDDEIENFICEVVNYANNTNGADFALDHFQVYTNTAKVKLNQEQGECDVPESNKTFIYADAEELQALYGKTGPTNIYWRIHDENGEVVMAKKMYDDYDTDGTGIYGTTPIDLNYTNYLMSGDDVVNETMVKANPDSKWFVGDDGKAYCKIAYRYLPGLLDGQTYYVSVYDPARQRSEVGFIPENNSYWGGLNTAARSKCSVFSPFFIPRQQFVIYYTDGAGAAEGGYIKVACGAAPIVNEMKMRLKKPDVTQPSGFTDIDNVLHFDYFFGTIAQWQSTDESETFTYGENNYSFKDLKEAYLRYRVNTYYNVIGDVHTDFNETLNNGLAARTVLQAAVNAKLIALDYSTTFSNNFNERPSKDFTVVCLPVEPTIPDVTPETAICSPFVVKFDIVWPKPEMELGFPDVEYPHRENLHRVIRIGLEQLNDLRNNGYKLHIPIHDYKDKDKNANSGTLYFQSNMLTVSGTNDPIGPVVGTNFAQLLTPESGWNSHGSTPFVDADHTFLALDLSGNNCAINFHEGYSYEVSTSFYDLADDQTTPCYNDIFLTIKVVPEYVTWDPQLLGMQTAGGVDYYNVNWNNDENWNRSERAELYMDDANTHQHNTPTTWRNSVTEGGTYYFGDKYYKNDNEINNNLDSDNAFVPMKFTYVTMPVDCHAPSLINMNLVAYNTSPYTGGAILAGNLITDPSPVDPSRTVNSPATPDILYDMLVRYSEKTCQGHLKSDKMTIFGQGTANVYDCEKFYGNICKEIYFKPRAELINQQRLTYEKAWVEKEIIPNQWYLMSSPLKATYAGDMYVPKADGKQTTEAFQPITFNTTSYSRTKYPFYQRSWDHGTGTNGSIVYTESSDPRQPYYDADMKFAGAVTSTFAQWSHDFNDVQVRYDQMQGFAIRTKQTGFPTGTALLRLPKADTNWNYYNFKDEQGTLNQVVTKGALNYGRFITDDDEGKPINNKAEMNKMLVRPNENTDNQYYLVGNPYMASLDMEKFFAENTHLGNAWWTIDGNPATGQATGRVRPMEAFFVKTNSPETGVNFKNSMMVDGNDGTLQNAPSRPNVILKASAGGTTSTAILEFSDNATSGYLEGEDVETLFDSNLADVPMVYTVTADGQAVSINQLPTIEVVPFGVTCSSNESVDVNINLSSLASNLSSLYVYDAVLGTTTAVNEGEAINIQPNDYGRYFLTTMNDLKDRHSSVAKGIVISVRNGVVAVTANSQIELVRAVSINGITAYEQSNCGTSASFCLQQGTYVIEADSPVGKCITKIIVR